VSGDSATPAAAEALDGRLPVLPSERVYRTYASLLWTTAVLSAASYAYLVGSAFQAFGNTRLTVGGYLVGLIIGEVVVVLTAGLPSWRYGIDTIDAAKATLGTRGAVVLLALVLTTCLGWAFVLVAMTARGIERLVSLQLPLTPAVSELVVIASALGLLVLIWQLVQRGPAAMERLSTLCAPVQVVVALLIAALLIAKFGITRLAGSGVPAGNGIITDPLAQVAYGVEFGFDNGLTMLPFLGGLTRLVRHRRHVMGPTVVGSGVVGAWIIASVAGFAGGVYAETDPTVWIVTLAGPGLGALVVGFLLVANVGTMVVQVYVAGVAVQQARALTLLPWKWLLALILAPGVLVAFRTAWLLEHVMNWLAYNGVMFVGLAGVLYADHYLVRRQALHPADLFARPEYGRYWYTGGVNWTAMAVLAGSGALYLALFDPVSMRSAPLFRYLGAGIPAASLGALAYWLLRRLGDRHRRRGTPAAASAPFPVGL